MYVCANGLCSDRTQRNPPGGLPLWVTCTCTHEYVCGFMMSVSQRHTTGVLSMYACARVVIYVVMMNA